MRFVFEGTIEGSKSIINRLLILEALHKNLRLSYLSHADDVLQMKKCLADFKNGKNTFDVGSGGTTFRFFSLFLSKYPGRWKIQMSEQLYSRPHEDLISILSQLGAQANFSKVDQDFVFYIETRGWKSNSASVDFSTSSQFFSGLALAASDLRSEFQIALKNYDLSSGYDEITYEILKKLNINVYKSKTAFKIHNKNLESKDIAFEVGADWSSVITLLSFAFSGSKIKIKNIDLNSSEPDLKGLDMLKKLGLEYKILSHERSNLSEIQVSPSAFSLKEIEFNFDKNPDLFPQFCILLGLRCKLYGVEALLKYPHQLVYKESDRLGLMKQALMRMGLKIEMDKSYLKILSFDKSLNSFNADKIMLDSKSDHRLVMCYELMKSFGMNLDYQDSKAVSKSFPSFFEIIGKKN